MHTLQSSRCIAKNPRYIRLFADRLVAISNKIRSGRLRDIDELIRPVSSARRIAPDFVDGGRVLRNGGVVVAERRRRRRENNGTATFGSQTASEP